MAPIPIQLALQGGGAKLCALMAAMQAVQKLDADGVLKVTKLAGTSAGSIVASLFAAGHDFEVLRTRVLDNRDRLRRLVPLGSSRVLWVLKMLAGRPAWSMAKMRDVLNELFREKGVSSFRDLRLRGRELVVVATDITNGAVWPYETDDALIVPAVLDSCALPFFFRGPAGRDAGSLIVDGGICENFPIDRLLADEKTKGVVLGISFPAGQSGQTPSNVVTFAAALLRAAIDNGVRQAQYRLGAGRVFVAETTVDTLDFEKALDHGFGDSYDLIFRKAYDFFSEFAESQGAGASQATLDRRWEEESAATLQSHADIYNAQHRQVKMVYHEAKMVTTVNALRCRNGDFRTAPDEVRYEMRFEPDRVPVHCHRVALVEHATLEFLETRRWRVRDRLGESIRTIDVLARDAAQSDRRAYLLFFDPVLQPGDPRGPYTLTYEHRIAGLMQDLALKRRDVLGIRLARAAAPIERVILVAWVPEAFPNLVLRPHANGTAGPPGRRMTEAELVRHQVHPPLGYYALGWIGENVPPEALFAADILSA